MAYCHIATTTTTNRRIDFYFISSNYASILNTTNLMYEHWLDLTWLDLDCYTSWLLLCNSCLQLDLTTGRRRCRRRRLTTHFYETPFLCSGFFWLFCCSNLWIIFGQFFSNFFSLLDHFILAGFDVFEWIGQENSFKASKSNERNKISTIQWLSKNEPRNTQQRTNLLIIQMTLTEVYYNDLIYERWCRCRWCIALMPCVPGDFKFGTKLLFVSTSILLYNFKLSINNGTILIRTFQRLATILSDNWRFRNSKSLIEK